MLVIEVDGASHQLESVKKKDLRKNKRLQQLGLTVMRFTDNEVLKHMADVLLTIEDYIVAYEGHTPKGHTPNPSQEGNC